MSIFLLDNFVETQSKEEKPKTLIEVKDAIT